MLKGSLYTLDEVKQPEEGKYTVNAALNINHEIFKGHFPGQPVLPGVCLLEMLKDIISQETGKSWFLSEGANIKYVKLVDPTVDGHLKFEIIIKEEPAGLTVSASTFLKSGEANFKFKGRFELK
ncbi:3-hydroxyacyl-ACP dehydratase [Fulvivirga kasyanovii]|uniref:3-hydroxyacyl-ACP dehydratase n=1 Tax=Fulvivirga kasyanovii TaxID=396812 RepID=A0ABW9RRJ6_9BACT|nr:3-hydroxyacyl-ACP dehydratase [Fulvivirga kasyanovii]MTI25655.1 3-hydroxyacyl-ACP dehydratase [Fulvivirga kasyanovii]